MAVSKSLKKRTPQSIKKVRKALPPPTRVLPSGKRYQRKKEKVNTTDTEVTEGC